MYTLPLTFARRDLLPSEAEFAVLGIPFDSSESFRTGSRLGPNAIRVASRDLEDYDMETGFDLLNLKITDMGDVEVSFGDFEETLKRSVETLRELLKNNLVPINLGGEHTITYFAAKALGKKVAYVVYDAHLDFREDYLENRFSHASVTKRLSEEAGVENLLLIGTRSASKEELSNARKEGLSYITTQEFYKDKTRASRRISEFTRGKRLFISVDMDVFDPSEAPGVGNPEPGGLHYRDVIESLSHFRQSGLAGLDITELIPTNDPYIGVLAAKVIFKILAHSKA
jgi:agmatinase